MFTPTPLSRNANVDIAKGLGIILVAFGHNWIVQQQPGELYRVIFSFHMPLFFFLSGVFLSPDRDLGVTLRQKADSLLKPYAAVLTVLAAWYMIPQQQFSPGYFLGMLYATGQSILWTPLWFLPNLFIAQILALLLLSPIKSLKKSSACLAALVVTLLLLGIPLLRLGHELHLVALEILPGKTRSLIGLPWSLDLVLVNTAFLLAGFLGARHVMEPGRQALPIALLSGALLALLHLLYDDTLNMNGRIYDSILISRHACCANVLAYLGTASLFIFIFHAFIQGKVTGLLQHQLPNHLHLAAFLGLLTGIFLPILIFEACRHSRLLSVFMLPAIRTQPQRA